MDKVIVNATSNITEEKLYTEKAVNELQAENEELKNQYSFSTILKIDKLKAENETLERTNNELRKRFSEDTTKLSAELMELQGKYNGLNANYNSLKFENERLKEENYGLNQELYQKGVQASEIVELKYTLQDISEIAKEISREKVHNPDIDTIITKINEVIGAE